MRKLIGLFVFGVILTCVTGHATYGSGGSGYGTTQRQDYYDNWGQNQGYSQKSPYSNKTNHYDQWGQSQGYSQRSNNGEVRHYDQWGQSIGTTKRR